MAFLPKTVGNWQLHLSWPEPWRAKATESRQPQFLRPPEWGAGLATSTGPILLTENFLGVGDQSQSSALTERSRKSGNVYVHLRMTNWKLPTLYAL